MVCTQNSINDETIARIVGYERVVGLIMSTISVNLVAPATSCAARRSAAIVATTSSVPASSAAPSRPARSRSPSCWTASTHRRSTTNLWGERWAKLATNCMGNTLTAMSGDGGRQTWPARAALPVLRDQVAREIVRSASPSASTSSRSAASCGRVAAMPRPRRRPTPPGGPATALGANGPPRVLPSLDPAGRAQGPQDRDRVLNGYVSRRGREVGVPTPVNDAIVRVLKQVDGRSCKPEPSNVDRVWELVYGRQAMATA